MPYVDDPSRPTRAFARLEDDSPITPEDPDMRRATSSWAKIFSRSLASLTRVSMSAGSETMRQAMRPVLAKRKPPIGKGDWLPGMVFGASGARHYRLFRPAGVAFGERLPLIVMLHGCQQDAKGFAASTRMNAVAARERFLVLYPEQDRISNPQGCWNWFDTKSGRANAEADLILRAIDQVCMLYSGDRDRVAVAGMSAGASMAALLVARHPARFRAVTMHSGVPPGTANSSLSAIGAMHGRRATKPLRSGPASPASPLPPLMVIHGRGDAVVAPDNGRAAARVWADATGAATGAQRTVQRGQRHPMQITDYRRSGRTIATLVEVDRLGHAWSGGAASERFSDRDGPDASRMVWAFSAKQFAPMA